MNFILFLFNTSIIVLLSFIVGNIFFFANKREFSNSIIYISMITTSCLSLVTILSYYTAFLNFNLKYTYLTLLIISIVIFIWSILKLQNSTSFFIGCFILLIGVIVSFYQFWPGIYLAFESNSKSLIASLGNHDIAYYLAVTEKFLDSGFTDKGDLLNNNLNYSAQVTQYFTPVALFAFFKTIVMQDTILVAMPVIFMTGSYFIINAARLSMAFFPQIGIRGGYLTGFVTFTGALMSYLYSSPFLAQFLAFGVSFAFVALILESLRGIHSSTRVFIEINLITILVIFTYPAYLIPFSIVSLVILVIITSFDKSRFKIEKLKPYFLGIFLGSILSIVYFPSVKWFLVALSSGDFGWSLPHLNPLKIYFFPQLIGLEFPKYFTIISWLIFIFIFIIIAFKSKIQRSDKFISILYLLLISFGTFFWIIIRNRGWQEYSTWKSISYVVPFSVIIAIPLLFRISRLAKYLVILIVGINFSIPTALWWGTTSTNQYMFKDFEELNSLKILNNLNGLNIDIQPNFYTMLTVNLIKGPKLSFVSNSYFIKNFDPQYCTLVVSWNESYVNKIKLNGTYSLDRGLNKDCK